MKVKKFALFFIILCFCMCATGCGTPLYELTEEEEDSIVYYSARVVSKFNNYTSAGLCNATIKDGELDVTAIQESEQAQGTSASDSSLPIGEFTAENAMTIDVSQLTEEEQAFLQENENGDFQEGAEDDSNGTYAMGAATDIGNILGTAGVDFKLKEFSIDDAYVATGAYAQTASSGCKYIILKVEANNTTDAAVDVDMMSHICEYNITVNGTSTAKSQTTILPDDLTTFTGTIEAGQSKNLVLLFQMKASELEYVDSVSLDISVDGSSHTIKL